MARVLRIERAIRWMAKTLTANRDPLPFPRGMTDTLNPVIDVFGSQRIEDREFAIVNGNLGQIEVFHTQVPEGRQRQYLSMEYLHDDVVPRGLRAGRILGLTGLGGAAFAGLRDEISVPAGQFLAVRNFTVGPGDFAAVTVAALGGGARIAILVLWIETPVGEYLRSVT